MSAGADVLSQVSQGVGKTVRKMESLGRPLPEKCELFINFCFPQPFFIDSHLGTALILI